MDTLSIIITLVSVVASLLQIILFFKIWTMCDDVRALRKYCATTQDNDNNKDCKVNNDGCGMLILAVILIILIVAFVIYKN
jgi:hypothetical protein